MNYFVRIQWRTVDDNGEVIHRDTVEEAEEDRGIGEPHEVWCVFRGMVLDKDDSFEDALVADCYSEETANQLCATLNAKAPEPKDKPHIEIPADAWRETGSDEDEKSRLLTTIVVNGCAMHLEAYAMTQTGEGEQRMADLPYFDDEEHALFTISHGAVCTIEINERTYALIATPHGS